MKIWYIKDGNTEPQSGHLYLAESLKIQVKNDPFIWDATEQMHIKEAWATIWGPRVRGKKGFQIDFVVVVK